MVSRSPPSRLVRLSHYHFMIFVWAPELFPTGLLKKPCLIACINHRSVTYRSPYPPTQIQPSDLRNEIMPENLPLSKIRGPPKEVQRASNAQVEWEPLLWELPPLKPQRRLIRSLLIKIVKRYGDERLEAAKEWLNTFWEYLSGSSLEQIVRYPISNVEFGEKIDVCVDFFSILGFNRGAFVRTLSRLEGFGGG